MKKRSTKVGRFFLYLFIIKNQLVFPFRQQGKIENYFKESALTATRLTVSRRTR